MVYIVYKCGFCPGSSPSQRLEGPLIWCGVFASSPCTLHAETLSDAVDAPVTEYDLTQPQSKWYRWDLPTISSLSTF